jgi:hypothetical protein
MVRNGDSNGFVSAIIAVIACGMLIYVVVQYNNSRVDTYTDDTGMGGDGYVASTNSPAPVDPSSQPYHSVDYPQPQPQEAPTDCFPKDRLTVSDLLPRDAANEQWAQANPAGQGDVSDQNFLTAGHHAGIDTIGSTLKIANLDLRSIPPNPRKSDLIWNQSSVEPDLNRRPLEIDGSC